VVEFDAQRQSEALRSGFEHGGIAGDDQFGVPSSLRE
jgi:hypothetical protein